METPASVDPTPWHAAFPEVQAQCPQLEADEVKEMLEKQAAAEGTPREFLLVDVRRTDWEGGTISSSINFPAHTFYQTRRIIHELCKQAGIRQVITYCGTRHTRALSTRGAL
jgi:arsenical-resistance protein 2